MQIWNELMDQRLSSKGALAGRQLGYLAFSDHGLEANVGQETEYRAYSRYFAAGFPGAFTSQLSVKKDLEHELNSLIVLCNMFYMNMLYIIRREKPWKV